MIKALSIIAGIVLIIVGLIVFPMPIPLGAIIIVCGLVLLVSASTTIAMKLREFRRGHHGADKIIRTVEGRLPASLKKALRRSNP